MLDKISESESLYQYAIYYYYTFDNLHGERCYIIPCLGDHGDKI